MTKSLRVKASVDSFDLVKDFMEQIVDEQGCDEQIKCQIMIAIEEVFINIASYAYEDKDGTIDVNVTVETTGNKPIYITFCDSGIPFDPLKVPDPDIHEDGMKRKIGGLGIFLLRQSMDHLDYSRTDGKNVLKIQHHLL